MVDYDIAQKIKGNILGIDKNQNNIDYAKKRNQSSNSKLVCGDVIMGLTENNMNVIQSIEFYNMK